MNNGGLTIHRINDDGIPMLRLQILLTAVLILAASALSADEPNAPDSEPAKITPAEIDGLVKQLSADRFAERELATQQLIEAGAVVIEPVAAAVRGDEPETVDRGLHVLRRLGLADDESTEDAARAALEKLAAEKQSRAASRAKNTLAYLNSLRQDRAIAAIRKLGGTVDETTYSQFVGVVELVTVYDVKIDESWKGGRKGLKYVRWLPDLRMVTFRGKQVESDWLQAIEGLEHVSAVELNRTSVDDAGVASLKSLPGLEQLSVKYSPITDNAIEQLKEVRASGIIMLFGTKITPQGAQKLRDAMADTGVRIDYRRGGFLGVGCYQTEAGCTISRVQPDSAALKADIRVGDVVTEFAGKPVPDFQSLTALIGEHDIGETVSLKLRRGDEELTKQLTLGEWD